MLLDDHPELAGMVAALRQEGRVQAFRELTAALKPLVPVKGTTFDDALRVLDELIDREPDPMAGGTSAPEYPPPRLG